MVVSVLVSGSVVIAELVRNSVVSIVVSVSPVLVSTVETTGVVDTMLLVASGDVIVSVVRLVVLV